MKNLTLRNLTEVCSGTWHGDDALRDREISAITTDSRKIEKDCLFVPIVGERVDAHRFIPDKFLQQMNYCAKELVQEVTSVVGLTFQKTMIKKNLLVF